jgi:MFS family permease
MRKLSILLFLLFVAISLLAQDTASMEGKAGVADVADADPGLFILMMLFLAGLLGAATAGAFICFFVFTIIMMAIATGLLSASVLVALYHRSVKAGFRTLVYLIFILIGFAGALGAYILYVAGSPEMSFQWSYALLLALPAGGIIGFICAKLFLRMFQRVVTLAQKKLIK